MLDVVVGQKKIILKLLTIFIFIQMRELQSKILLMFPYVVNKLGERDVTGVLPARLCQEFLECH